MGLFVSGCLNVHFKPTLSFFLSCPLQTKFISFPRLFMELAGHVLETVTHNSGKILTYLSWFQTKSIRRKLIDPIL